MWHTSLSHTCATGRYQLVIHINTHNVTLECQHVATVIRHIEMISHIHICDFFFHSQPKKIATFLINDIHTAQHHLTCHAHVACTIQCTKLIQILDIYKEYTVSLSAKKSQRNIHNNMTLHCPLFYSVAFFTFSLLHVSLPVL